MDETFYDDGTQCFLEKEAWWSEITRLSQKESLEVLLNNAFVSLENKNKHVKGVLSYGFFTNLICESKNLHALLNEISSIYAETNTEEFVEIFQNFLNICVQKRSDFEEEKKYTPISVAKLLVALANPYEGNIYDPCFGTGNLLVEATKYIRQKHRTMDNLFFYGQELSFELHQFAKINQAINLCEFKLGEPRDTFSSDLYKNKKMDYILANFPLDQKDNRFKEDQLINDERWILGHPCNSNWAWISHIIYHLEEEGIATFLIPQKELDNLNSKKHRKKLVENDWIEAIISLPSNNVYSNFAHLAILVINKDKQKRKDIRGEEVRIYRDRSKEILFIDISGKDTTKRGEGPSIIEEKSEWIINTLTSWRYENLDLKEELQENQWLKSVNLEEVRDKNYSLSIAQYNESLSKEEKELQQINELEEKKRGIESRLLQLFENEEELKECFREQIDKNAEEEEEEEEEWKA